MNDATDADALNAPAPESTAEAENQGQLELDAEHAETGEGQESEPSESSTEKQSKKLDGVQKRIDEITRQRREAERERDYWKQQAAARAEEAPPKPDLSGIKKLEDFEYDESRYAEYLMGEAMARGAEEAKRVLSEEHHRDQQIKRLSAYESKEADFAEKLEAGDYFDVTRDPSLAFTEAMHEIVTGMEGGPGVLYFLGKNPQVADRIARLDNTNAAIELGRIEERLTRPAQDAGTKAPKPPARLGGSGEGGKIAPTSPDSDKLSMKEWLARRNKAVNSN